jgi:predicted outer membrane lipoprotein
LQNGKLRRSVVLAIPQPPTITIALVIGLGLLLAAFSILTILALENASAASQEALQNLSTAWWKPRRGAALHLPGTA